MNKIYMSLVLALLSLPVFANWFSGEGFYSLEHEIAVVSYEDSASCETDNGKWNKEEEICYFSASNDVEISLRLDGDLDVRVSTISTNFHTCDFEGVGKWQEGGFILAKGILDASAQDNCELKLEFVTGDEVNVITNEQCSYYCGANAGLEFPSAKRVVKNPLE